MEPTIVAEIMANISILESIEYHRVQELPRIVASPSRQSQPFEGGKNSFVPAELG
jgi:hypothetical protein